VAKFQGIYALSSDFRRHDSKPDRCFYITFRIGKRKVWEKIGWASEGYSAALAAQIRAERIREARHGTTLPRAKNPTFGQVWEKYDVWLTTNRKSQFDERSRYANHLKPRFENVRLSDISPFALEKMKSELSGKGLAPATVRHCLMTVRQVINRARAWELWQGENPVRKVKMPTVNNRRERYLTPEEARELLKRLKERSGEVHDMALLSLETGMRAGEIFGLRWVDVDLKNRLLHIADPKGGAPRKVPITGTVAEMLNQRRPGEREELVFRARGGGRHLGMSDIYFEVVQEVRLNDGVKDPRQKVLFHTLRHTFASWLALQGVPILTIKELLGHKSLAMTERYAHLSPDHRRDAVERVEKLLTGAGEKEKKKARNRVKPR